MAVEELNVHTQTHKEIVQEETLRTLYAHTRKPHGYNRMHTDASLATDDNHTTMSYTNDTNLTNTMRGFMTKSSGLAHDVGADVNNTSLCLTTCARLGYVNGIDGTPCGVRFAPPTHNKVRHPLRCAPWIFKVFKVRHTLMDIQMNTHFVLVLGCCTSHAQ
jgi:hypothetical protein